MKVREQWRRDEEMKRQEEEAKVEWWRQKQVSQKLSVCHGGANSVYHRCGEQRKRREQKKLEGRRRSVRPSW